MSYKSDWLELAEQFRDEAEGAFRSIGYARINEKDDDGWSIGAYLEHLIKTNERFFPKFEEIIQGGNDSPLWKAKNWFTTFFTQLVYRSKDPAEVETEEHASLSNLFEKDDKTFTESIVGAFVQSQNKLIELVRQLPEENLESQKVTSPASPYVFYSLKNCLRIILHHQQDYLKRANKILGGEESRKVA